MFRLPSRLDDKTEACVTETMDCGFLVHRARGPGYGEAIYGRAFCLELDAGGIPFECEKSVVISYRDTSIGMHRVDLVVRGCVVVELKAARGLERVHEAQLISYLKATGLPVGLLMNFAYPTLKEGLKRIVL